MYTLYTEYKTLDINVQELWVENANVVNYTEVLLSCNFKIWEASMRALRESISQQS